MTREWKFGKPRRKFGWAGIRGVCCAVLALATLWGCDGVTGAEREALYESNANGQQRLDRALEEAKAAEKRVLVVWGANWCVWCHKLHAFFENNAEVREILRAGYVVVTIDSDYNKPLMRKLGVEARGIPYLSVFDAEGNKLTDQDTGSLEAGGHHDPEKVIPFLQRWLAPEAGRVTGSNTRERLASAQAIAGESDRNVLVVLGAKWCGWCDQLDALFNNKTIKPLLRENYVVVKIDVEKLEGAKEFRAANAPNRSRGVPWYAVLAPEGAVLSTADNEEGNTGYPVRDDEIKQFMSVIKSTAKHLDASELESIEAEVRRIARERSQ